MRSLSSRSKSDPSTSNPTTAGASQPASKPAEAETSPNPGGDADLGTVRDILFGAQWLEIQAEIKKIGERMTKEVADLRSDIRQQIGALERQVQNEVRGVAERLNTETKSRNESLAGIQDKLGELGKEADAKLTDFHERARKGQRELRDQLLSQSNLLTDAIQQRHEEATHQMAVGMQELRTSKADRASLSTLLMELAGRLEEDAQPAEGPDARRGS